MRLPFFILSGILALAIASCFGCAALKTDKVATTCASASAAIKTLTLAKRNGLVAENEQKSIDAAISVVTPICTANPEPTASEATVNALNAAANILTTAASIHPGGS